MKKFMALVIFSVLLFTYCSKNEPTGPEIPSATPTSTPTFTVTSTGTGTYTVSSTFTQTLTHTVTPSASITMTATNTPEVVITVALGYSEHSSSGGCNTYISANGTPVANATVTIDDLDDGLGPTYINYVTNSGANGYYYKATGALTANHDYKCEISFDGCYFEATLKMPGDITISADGLSLSWIYPGNVDTEIRVYQSISLKYLDYESGTSHTISPNPYVSGTYSCRVWCRNQAQPGSGGFDGAEAASFYQVTGARWQDVTP